MEPNNRGTGRRGRGQVTPPDDSPCSGATNGRRGKRERASNDQNEEIAGQPEPGGRRRVEGRNHDEPSMTAASTSDATPSALQPRNEEHDDVVFVKCLVEGESHGVHPSTTTTTLTPTEQAVSTNRGPGTPYQGTFFPRFSGDSVRTGRFAPQSQAAARITTGEGQLQSSGPHPGYRTAFLSIDGMTKAQMTVKLHESVAATFQWASLMSENDDEGVQQLGAELKELRNMCTVLQQQLEVQKRQNSALEIRLNSIEDIAGNTESQVKETKTKVEETTTKLCSLDQRMMRISRVFTALDG